MTADDLYGLPLARFVPERAALARVLRGEKRREEAAAVAALRKPTVAAWAVNQLVRTQGPAIEELFAAGDALRQAQAALLGGAGDARALRTARDRERTAVDRLVTAAGGLLDADGHELSPAVLERVAETLHAAALDDAAREQVEPGRLERELRHVGLGGGGLEPAAAPRGSGESAPPARGPTRRTAAPPAPSRRGDRAAEAERRRRAEEAGERRRREEAAAREAAAAARAARSEEAAARRRAERADRALAAAEERRRRAAEALDEAERALAGARAEADAARQEHERARRRAH